MSDIAEIQLPTTWSRASWRSRPALQQPSYPDDAALVRAQHALGQLPSLVTAAEIDSLKAALAAASRGEMFLLQGGDCCESFAECQAPSIANKLRLMLQMSLLLARRSAAGVIRVGRIAGQYAKPRSVPDEVRADTTLPAYRGDMINRAEFTRAARTPDPQLMVTAHQYAARTMQHVRAFAAIAGSELRDPVHWHSEPLERAGVSAAYAELLPAIGSDDEVAGQLARWRGGVPEQLACFTSHEALLLPYEQAHTHALPGRSGWYNLATHFPWIGNRTRQPDGAHVEYCRGIANPIAVKIGPQASAADVNQLIELLNPEHEPGRLTLIHRFGVDAIGQLLPELIARTQPTGDAVLWCCDPMHGNTVVSRTGVKTRRFDDIERELVLSFQIHQQLGSRLAGVHLEFTGDHVTECIGGASGIGQDDLYRAYRTHVDPRLNCEQSLEITLRIAELLAATAAA